MPKKGDVHVVRGSNGGWQVRVEGTGRAHSIHNTQAEATKAGRGVAQKKKSELLVHGRDGKIRERSTFGNDPRRTKG
jgi:ketosteroid isomerase-like protein